MLNITHFPDDSFDLVLCFQLDVATVVKYEEEKDCVPDHVKKVKH